MKVTEYYEKVQNDWLNENKDKLIEFVKNSKEEFSFIELGLDLEYIKNNYKTKEDVEKDIPKFSDNGITLRMFTQELEDFICDNLPRSIKKLNVPAWFIEQRVDYLKEFPYLEEITVNSTIRNINGLARISDELNLKKINVSEISTLFNEDFSMFHNALVAKVGKDLYFENDLIKYNKKTENNEDIKRIKLYLNNTSIKRGLEILKTYNISNKCDINIFVNGKEMVESVLGDFEILLENDALDIIPYLNLIGELGLSYQNVRLVCDNKTIPNMKELKRYEEKYKLCIKFQNSLQDSSIDDFIAMRATLDYYVGLIKGANLSPAEEVCYAYDLIKSFEYNENEEDLQVSRNIESIIRTGKIVCVGYSVFLAELLKELGLKSYAFSTSVPLENGSVDGHQRCMVCLDDDKYGIHGEYALDATWDSNRDYYLVLDPDGNRYITTKVEEGQTIVKKFDSMSSYRCFLVSKGEYQDVFKGEKMPKLLSDGRYDPNDKAELFSMSHLSFVPEGELVDSEKIEVKMLMEIIKQTRIAEGYDLSYNDAYLDEVEEMLHPSNENKAKTL